MEHRNIWMYYPTISGSRVAQSVYWLGCGLNDLGPAFLQNRDYSPLPTSGPLMEVTHLPAQWLQRALSPTEKRSRRETQQLPSCSARKKKWVVLYVYPSVRLNVVCRDSFTFSIFQVNFKNMPWTRNFSSAYTKSRDSDQLPGVFTSWTPQYLDGSAWRHSCSVHSKR